jgi:hypothetical protein
MSQCMFDKYWNSASSPPGPRLDPSTGKPYVFQLGTKTYSSCASEGWTSLNVDSNSTSVIQNLMVQRNPIALSIGDLIWIEPGSKTSLNTTVNGCSTAGDKTCQYVLIPLAVDITTHAHNPITGCCLPRRCFSEAWSVPGHLPRGPAMLRIREWR